ncbi:MAG TPA: complement resistance protein TraT [Pseudomonadales bacterium]|jgi:hypothetical protein|nr:hypothetical protein [Pseudomonadales bacterium]HMU90236.1 complement resistance protein TraT [Pseudomonadales bacterium]HMW16042.1 complement resistance protein TraT [Pseudomonadales bacterium]HMW82247.1 complement resistance protein TraT [Pseudomonadales bacterium]HMY97765.1 complement resistance protein TraT [Pseudomonadales bacterium]
MACLLLITLVVAGCGQNVKKEDPSGLSVNGIDLQVKMSANLFIPPPLPPVAESQRRIYLIGTNTSTAQAANERLQPLLIEQLLRRGYLITDNPAEARYMLLYNVLYVGKEVRDLSTITAVSAGVGGAAVAATIGRNNETVQNAGIGGLVGTVTGAVTGHYFETNTFEQVVDLQIRERQPAVPAPLPPEETKRLAVERAIRQVNLALGLGELHTETTPETDQRLPPSSDNWQLYSSQVVGFATRLRLQFEEAEPLLFQAMAREISGLFWDLHQLPGNTAPRN